MGNRFESHIHFGDPSTNTDLSVIFNQSVFMFLNLNFFIRNQVWKHLVDLRTFSYIFFLWCVCACVCMCKQLTFFPFHLIEIGQWCKRRGNTCFCQFYFRCRKNKHFYVEEEAQVIEYSRVSIRNMHLLIKEGFFQLDFG